MDQERNTARVVLARHPCVQIGILFGSRAAGRQTSSSDLDVAVAADLPLNATQKIELIDDCF